MVLELAELSFDELLELFAELSEEPFELPELSVLSLMPPPSGGVGAALPEADCPFCPDESSVVASESLDEDVPSDMPPLCWLGVFAVPPSCPPAVPEGPPCDMLVCSVPV